MEIKTDLVDVWTDSADLAKFGEHDDDVAVVLPQHSPEVLGRLGQRTLRRDVRSPETIALHAQTVGFDYDSHKPWRSTWWNLFNDVTEL